jgi:ATP-binding cassette subfamily B multidrug efflux pump
VGAGKSALARALLGLYPLEGGRVLLDGQAVETLDPAARAARVGYLSQDAYLFSGSVRENVLLPPPEGGAAPGGAGARRRRVGGSPAGGLDRAVSVASLEEDVDGFPEGLDTEIGELGVRVSGGQRQRIALARAIAAPAAGAATADDSAAPGQPGNDPERGPGLLVLDDPFSAVDVDTEARIVAALRQAFGPAAPRPQRATILLCSHRLTAFPQADQVVVLDGGRVVARGTHAALLRQDGLYARIFRAQHRVALPVAGAPPVASGSAERA